MRGTEDNQPLVSGNQRGGPGGYNPGNGYPQAGGAYGDSSTSKAFAMASSSQMNDVYFGAAMCIVVSSLIGGASLFFSMRVVEWLQMSYLMIFGLFLAVLDTPFLKTMKLIGDLKLYVFKYFQFVTRVTGKGVILVFLGTSTFLTTCNTIQDGFVRFFAALLGLFPTLVGLASIAIGALKSSKLDKARRQIALVIDHQYDQYALTDRGPSGGLTMSEFNGMCEKNGGIRFESLDLKLIFNALVSNPTWRANLQGPQQSGGYANDEPRIPRSDLMDWCHGGMVFL